MKWTLLCALILLPVLGHPDVGNAPEARLQEAEHLVDAKKAELALSILKPMIAEPSAVPNRVQLEALVLAARAQRLIADWPTATAYAERAVAGAVENQWPRLQGDGLLELGQALAGENELTRARDHYIQAEQLFEQAGDDERRASAWALLGNVEPMLGNSDHAIKYLKRQIAYYSSAENGEALTKALRRLADVYWRDQKRYQDAAVAAKRAIEAATSTDNFTLQAEARYAEIAILAESGELDDAVERADELLEFCQLHGLRRVAAYTESIKGFAYGVTRRPLLAMRSYERAYSLADEDQGRFQFGVNLVSAALQSNQYEAAERYVDLLSANPVARSNPVQLGRLKAQQAIALERQDERDAAFVADTHALPYLYARGDNPRYQRLASGQICSLEGNDTLRAFACKLYLEAWTQDVRGNAQMARRDRLTQAGIDRLQFESLVSSLIRLNRYEEGERVIAMFRLDEERYWRQTIAETDFLDLPYSESEKVWAERYEALTKSVGEIQPSPDFVDKIQPYEARFESLFRDARLDLAKHPGIPIDGLADVPPAGVAQISLFVLDDQLVGESRGGIASIVRVGSQIEAGIAKISTAELDALANRFRTQIQNPLEDPRETATALHTLLIRPHLEFLNRHHVATLAIRADGVLQNLPIAALYDGRQWLVERFAVVRNTVPARLTRPAGVIWKDARVAALGTDEAGLGLPALPYVASELDTVVKTSWFDRRGIFGGELAFRDDFTLAAIETAGSRSFNILHIAGHFVMSPDSDSESFLLLGGGKRVSLEELAKSDIDLSGVELVTLSACSTGVNATSPFGGNVDGLSRLLRVRGAHSVLATLWPAVDDTTSILVTDFYRSLTANESASAAAALREAQISMIRGTAEYSATRQAARRGQEIMTRGGSATTGESTHPYFWAPFVLTQ